MSAAVAAPIPILTYHQIAAPPPRGAPFRSLTVSPEAFGRQMRWLRRLGYRGLSMRDLMPYLAGAQRGKVVGITFDDGFANVFEHALPILRELGFTATNYCVAGQVGGGNGWDTDKGVAAQPLMTAAQMRAWHEAGLEIGSHTLEHRDLTTLTLDQARTEIVDSRQRLQDLLAAPVTAFCYPYGHYSAAHADLARAAGYTSATTTRRGRVRAGGDAWQLPRVPVVRSTWLWQLWQKCFTSYEDRRGGASA